VANTKTFLEVITRIKVFEGHQNDDSASNEAAIRLDINTVYSDLATMADWYWLVQNITLTTTDGQVAASLPTNVSRILSIIHPDGESIIEERDRVEQIEMKKQIERGGRQMKGTFAVDGIDVSGDLSITFAPAAGAGDYSVRVMTMPVELVADGDIMVGPPEIFTYLIWKTRQLRLMDDEERPSLVSQAERRSSLVLDQMMRRNGTLARGLRRFNPQPRSSR